MDVTPSPRPAPSRVRQRHDAQRRASHSEGDDDHVLDAILVELGIPDSGSKKMKNTNKKRSNPEIIELITPPQPKKSKSDGRRDSIVDLTTSPSSSPSHIAEKIIANASSQEDDMSSDVDFVDFSYSPSGSPPPFVTVATASSLPEPESESMGVRREVFPEEERGLETERAGPKQARRLSGRLRDLHSETTRNGATKQRRRREEAVATRVERAVSSSSPAHSRSISNGKGRTASSTGAGVVAVVQLERSLDASSAGESIRSALLSHIYNNKSVPYSVGAALDCRHPGVIRWERQDGTAKPHVSCAIYYEAEVFLQMLQQKNYEELLAVVRYLQTLAPQQRSKSTPSQQSEEEEPSKIFIIVEGMDRALIQLKKQQKQKQKKGPASSATSPMITFADLHELAFQLFMDIGAHTKFTCDLDATASYVALLTRELVVASSRPSAVEEFLESVPRYNSIRVTRVGGTTSASANAWLRMLQVVPGVSEDKAQSLLDHFPTFDSLMRAYRDPSRSREEKEGLVSDKLHDVRIEHTLSRRIYSVFCEEDPDVCIP